MTEEQPNYAFVAFGYVIAFMLLFSAMFGIGKLVPENNILIRAITGMAAGLMVFGLTYYMNNHEDNNISELIDRIQERENQ